MFDKGHLTVTNRYEMYGEEAAPPDANILGPNQALELNYYSNGEVVW